ncbi:MAG TPA: chromate efflux transporter, partial [Thermodesulfobacteriota bacterium]|nr:chromate efflux transporter [Thermodesulfobacteriota bacterium]
MKGIGEVSRLFLVLGLTAFGGPNAHLALFQRELVERRGFLGPAAYAELVALCQFLPGPASSQVAIGLGTYRAGPAGGLAAWLAFTLPSALAMIAFAYGVARLAPGDAGWIHGLKGAALAIVAQAVWDMGHRLAPDWPRRAIAALTAAAMLLWHTPAAQLAVLAAAGAAGAALFDPPRAGAGDRLPAPIPVRAGLVCLALFFALLLLLPAARAVTGDPWLAQLEAFYRVGSLVFGGGHVVLPLMEARVVGAGWVNRDEFLAGYGAVQAMPGPLFSFAAYLGAASRVGPGGLAGGLAALAAVYLPSFLLLFGALPLWERLRRLRLARAALTGLNAAVVGLLAAALYDPLWREAVRGPFDFLLALAALAALTRGRWPPWLVVIAAGTAGGVRDLV